MTMPIPDGSVIITPRQMYDKLEETHKAVTELIQTVNPALNDIKSDAADLKSKVEDGIKDAATVHNDHGNRLTALETRSKVMGTVVGAVIVVFGGAIGTVIAHVWH